MSWNGVLVCWRQVFQITLKKGYGITDLKVDLGMLYQKAGVKSVGTVLLMTDAQV